MHAATIEPFGSNQGILTLGQSGFLVGERERTFSPVKIHGIEGTVYRAFPLLQPAGTTGRNDIVLIAPRTNEDSRLLALVCGAAVDLGYNKPIPMVHKLKENKSGCAGLAWGQTSIGEEYLVVLMPGTIIRVQDPVTGHWEKYRWDGRHIERLTCRQHTTQSGQRTANPKVTEEQLRVVW